MLAAVAVAIALLAWANWPAAALPDGITADRLVVLKSQRQLVVYSRGEVLKTYRVSLGRHPVGRKQYQGDGRTPEGLYAIDLRKTNTCCFRSLEISYPNAADRAWAAAHHVSPGGLVMVHGIGRGFGWVGRLQRFYDWTDGCVAVTNREMAELWRVVPVGTPIELRP